jgi:putative PIN family toxin of toxin-antitoxin system
VRVVIDPSVFVAAALSKTGASNVILQAWLYEARFEVIACPELFEELLETLHKPKLLGRFQAGEPARSVGGYAHLAEMRANPAQPERISRDLEDDYLVWLALESGADALISLDQDLLVLNPLEVEAGRIPVVTPGDFLKALREAGVK